MVGIKHIVILCVSLVVMIAYVVSAFEISSLGVEAVNSDGECGDGITCEEDVCDEETYEETEEITEEPEYEISESDASVIAQVLYKEIGAGTKLEQSAVVWCILNRVDSEIAYFPDTIEEVCKQKIGKNPMFAYDPESPVREDLYEMAVDVMTRWYREKNGESDVGRTLPKEYVYFWGDGKHNYFRVEYQGKNYWDWSLKNPYEG